MQQDNLFKAARERGLSGWFASRLAGLMLAALAVFFLVVQSVHACSCTPPPAPGEALADSTAVFAGKVTRIRERGAQNQLEVTLHVYQSWKGSVPVEVVLLTPANGATCGYPFEKDKDYLVYAQEVDGSLQVSLCSRTKLLNTAGEDLDVLKEGQSPLSAETPVSTLNHLLSSWGAVIGIGIGLGFLYILLVLLRSWIIRAVSRQPLPVDPETPDQQDRENEK